MGKQKKRKIVPATLHSEISEYASLLRVLRTTDALDITTQLTRLDSAPSPWRATSVAPTSSHVDRGGTSRPSIGDKGHPSATDASTLPRTSRNTWTRWPLLAEDIHIPEWRFEDEIHSLATQAILSDFLASLPMDTSSESPGIGSHMPTDDRIEALFPPSSLRALADVSSSHLESILSALASYIPLVDKSTQHRRHPISWVSVLKIVSATGLVDGNVIRNVKSRLGVIYGSHLHSSDVPDNVPELPAMVTLHDLDSANFFDEGNPGNRRKRGPYKKSVRKAPTAHIHQRPDSSSAEGT
ncbi:hypothetical protein BJV74DRAFT_839891 [Russula compacta]|nr:hypothetical protein BJV74DRAFT_839891 [Russula compacta]